MSNICYVIGSGPAGVACAYGLLQQGKRVVMLDCGRKPEPESSERYLRNFDLNPIQNEDLEYFRRPAARLGGIPLKLKYGSDFAYDLENIELDHAAVCGSLAEGGLSNVWGAAVLPFRKEELQNWPIAFADLQEGYRKVLDLFQLMAKEDSLAEEFPLYTASPKALIYSDQAEYVYQKMQQHQEKLGQQGFTFGHSRLAFNRNHAHSAGCIYCGLCFYGCYKNQIFCSSDCLSQLAQYGTFEYRDQMMLEKFVETAEGVTLAVKDLTTGQMLELKGDSVFMGAGVINTVKIVAQSLEQENKKFNALDTQYFLMPALLFKSFSGQKLKEVFTLAQLFLELKLPKLAQYIHLQLYTYNEVIEKELRHQLKKLWGASGMVSFLMRRMAVLQGFLPSDPSQRLEIQVKENSVQLTGIQNNESLTVIRQVKKVLLKNYRNFGFLPLTLATDIGLAGRGFHIGGTLPMVQASSLRENTTDSLGRLFGFKRVHIVDASVLPNLPAATITYTVMANAYRIGAHA